MKGVWGREAWVRGEVVQLSIASSLAGNLVDRSVALPDSCESIVSAPCKASTLVFTVFESASAS